MKKLFEHATKGEKMNNKNIKGFTLAEVLITLSILGVVAAIMIPSTMHKITDKQTVARVKLAYSLLSNAIDLAVIEKGPIENWDWPDKTKCWAATNAQYLARQMQQYFNIKTNCTAYPNTTMCFGGYDRNTATPLTPYESGYHNFRLKNLGNRLYNNNGTNWGNYFYGYQLKNGISIAFSEHCMNNPPSSAGNGMYGRNGVYGRGTVYVDINGPKGPNKIGEDFFMFRIKRYPGSLDLWTNVDLGGSSDKNLVDRCSVEKAKTTKGYDGGQTCSNHIIKYGNMDYKYRELSATEF